jgi:hypothetical protein
MLPIYKRGQIIEVKDTESEKVSLRIRITGSYYSESCHTLYYNVIEERPDVNGKFTIRSNNNYTQTKLMRLQVKTS